LSILSQKLIRSPLGNFVAPKLLNFSSSIFALWEGRKMKERNKQRYKKEEK